jgi:hypothetical protein
MTTISWLTFEDEEERERIRKDSITVEVKRKHLGKAPLALCLRGKKSILLEGTQAMPDRPSDKDRMGEDVRIVGSKSLRQRR